MNIFTHSKKHRLYVRDAKDQPVAVPYRLARRWGWDDSMVAETVNHFAFLCAISAAGMEWNPNHSKFQEYSTRTEYTDMPDPLHHEARVVIWTDDFPVWNSEAIEFHEVNVFTEETSALQAWENIQSILGTDYVLDEINNRLRPANTPQKRNSAPTRHVAPQQRQSDLDKHFGPQNSAPVDEGGGTVELPDGVIWENDAPLIQQWNYKIEDEYNHLFVGGVVNVRVGKVARVLDAKKDGSGTYEVVRFWPYYSLDRLTKYPPFALSFFVGPKEENYDWATFAEKWEQHFPEPGSTLEEDGIAIFKVQKGKNGDKVYWNFKGLRFEDTSMPTRDFEHVGLDQDDIPF